MRGAWRVAEVRAAEKRLAGSPLMARAATGLARRCADLLGKVYGTKVLLLVGSGDNGGDTLYAGALLARRGAGVSAFLVGSRTHPEALAAFRAAGGRIVTEIPVTADLVLDGIVGIGGTGGLRPGAAEAVARLPVAPVVAVDLPSGVDADTGAVAGAAVRADVTVTFGCLKPGLLVGAGASLAGQVDLVDIGLALADPFLRIPGHADVRAWWPRPRDSDDKYSRGVVGVAAGSRKYPGAAVLAVAGASAGPTGYLRYAGASSAAIRAAYPHVVTAERVADAGRVQAWAIGSGLSVDSAAQSDLRSVLASGLPVCLDADALTLVAEHPDWLAGAARPVVLTPHDGEYARLAGRPVGPDRVAAALDLARDLDAVILLKGARTIVADPAGTVYVNPTGSPALATAGTGDVLAGLLGSLLAAGVPATEAAVCAAYAHGLAGRRSALDGPVTSLTVAGALRGAVGALLAGRGDG